MLFVYLDHKAGRLDLGGGTCLKSIFLADTPGLGRLFILSEKMCELPRSCGIQKKGGEAVKNCIVCGSEAKHPSFDFCEKCFAMSIERIEERQLKKGPLQSAKINMRPPAERTFASLPTQVNPYHKERDLSRASEKEVKT